RAVLVEFDVLMVEARRDVAGLLAALQLLLVGVDDVVLNGGAAGGVDGMGDVGMELESPGAGAAVAVAVGAVGAHEAVLVQASAAVVAEAGAQVVLVAAARAVVAELARGHG